MKVEIKIPENEQAADNNKAKAEIHAPSCDVAIDIGQVLAANQALLKNMARKMEKLENKLETMEKAYKEQSLLLQMERKKQFLLSAPAPEIRPWKSKKQELDEIYFNKFSLIDRIFRPWVMRRKNLDS